MYMYLMIWSGQSTNDKMIKLLEKNAGKLLLLFWSTFILPFLRRTLQYHIFQSCISHLFIDMQTPLFAESHSPRFNRSIATPSAHSFFRTAYPMLVWSRLSISFKSRISPTQWRIPQNLVVPNHPRSFSESHLSLFPLYTHPPSIFRNGIVRTSPLSYIHIRQPTNPRPMPTNFYGLVGFDRVKIYPLWLKSVSIPDQNPLYPRCIPDAPTLKSRSSRPFPSFRLTNPRYTRPTPTYSWYNYAHYAQYRTNLRSVCLISTLGLKWINQANVMPTDSLMRFQYPKCAYDPYC